MPHARFVNKGHDMTVDKYRRLLTHIETKWAQQPFSSDRARALDEILSWAHAQEQRDIDDARRLGGHPAYGVTGSGDTYG